MRPWECKQQTILTLQSKVLCANATVFPDKNNRQVSGGAVSQDSVLHLLFSSMHHTSQAPTEGQSRVTVSRDWSPEHGMTGPWQSGDQSRIFMLFGK